MFECSVVKEERLTCVTPRRRIDDDIPEREKRRLTVDDLLDKFDEVRKTEKLTAEMIEQFRREYR